MLLKQRMLTIVSLSLSQLFCMRMACAQETTAKPAETPTGEATPAPVISEEKKPEVSAETPTAPVDEHAETPAAIRNKLRVGAKLGIGIGSVTVNSAQEATSDLLSFSLFSSYPIEFSLLQNLSTRVYAMYNSNTGVVNNKIVTEGSSIGFAAQRFQIGAGGEYSLGEGPLSIEAGLLLGLIRANLQNIDTGATKAAEHKLASGVLANALYRLTNEVRALGGVDVQVGKYSWYGVSIGLEGTF